MMLNLPVFPVVFTLLAAPLVVATGRARMAWLISWLVCLAATAASALLLAQALQTGSFRFDMGGWPAPFGIEYRIDALSAGMALLLCGSAALMLPYGLRSVEAEIARGKIPLFYGAFLLCLAGLVGITQTNDIFNIYVFLEVSSLTAYTLIAMGRHRKALVASFQYLILGTVGATFILIGIGLLYMMTGSLNISDVALRLLLIQDARPVQAAFAFLTVGISLKIALFPLHKWLPNAYTYAPSFVSAFLAATATKVGIYLLLRIFFTLFGHDFSFGTMPLTPALMTFSLAAIVYGSLAAIFQRGAKKTMAFSSIAQIGYITLGIALATETGVSSGIVHIFNHAVTKGALFLALGCFALRLGDTTLDHLRGMGRRMPWTAMGFTLAGISLIGAPLTAGFVSKWLLLQALLDQGLGWIVVVILISSLMALYYVWRIVETLYFAEPYPAFAPRAAAAQEAPLLMLVPLWLAVGLSWYLGMDTTLTVDIAQSAAAMLIGGNL